MTDDLKGDSNPLNRDPFTGEPGSHPVGVSLGTVVGASAGVVGAMATGAALGTVAGPLGGAAGAVVGGIVGAAAGKSLAEAVNPTADLRYWQSTDVDYEVNEPAYRYGIDSYGLHEGRSFDDIEPVIRDEWNSARGSSTLEWEQARHAVRGSYERLYNSETV